MTDKQSLFSHSLNERSSFRSHSNKQSLFSPYSNKILSWIKENKWLVVGVVIAILNPVPSGVILGIVMLTEEKLVKIGRIVLAISVVLVVVTFLIFLLSSKR